LRRLAAPPARWRHRRRCNLCDRDRRRRADPDPQQGPAPRPARGDGPPAPRRGRRSRRILLPHRARVHRARRSLRLAQQVDLRLRGRALCEQHQAVGLARGLMSKRRWTITAAILGLALAQAAGAREIPARTPWGDPDLRGTWPIQRINDARIPLQRPDEFGTRAWLTDEEFAERLKRAEQSDAAFSNDLGADGTVGLVDWLRTARMGRRNSLVVEPADGRLPPLTPRARDLYAKGRSTWQASEDTHWVSDLDAFERCITRGFPAVMLPQPYNNGLRVFQAPGHVVIQLETFGTRVIPIGRAGHWPTPV